jgi:Cys-rich protein (TIGR01571 family)
VVGRQAGDVCTAKCAEGYWGEPERYDCGSDGAFVGDAPTCFELQVVFRGSLLSFLVLFFLFLSYQYRFWCMHRKIQLTSEEHVIPEAMRGRWLEEAGLSSWEVVIVKKAEANSQDPFGNDPDDSDSPPKQQLMHEDVPMHGEFGDAPSKSSTSVMKNALEELREEIVHEVEENRIHLDGLTSPCEDPDLCLTCVACPCCRVADTWHTIGKPSWLTYWKVLLLYALCPCFCCCLNFLGRLKVRKAFSIPAEPHRDCLIHCCCCCCCSPCAICQEARLVDAPTTLYTCTMQLHDLQEKGQHV